MGVGVISDNTTIKVNQAVSATRTTDGTIYTCVATGYAIVNISILGVATAANIDVSLAGRNLINGRVEVSGSTNFNGSATPTSTNYECAMVGQIMVGPSQALSVTGISGTGATINVTGVEFINSP